MSESSNSRALIVVSVWEEESEFSRLNFITSAVSLAVEKIDMIMGRLSGPVIPVMESATLDTDLS